VAQEISTVRGLDKDKIVGAIRQAVAERHGLQIHAVALLKPRSIPKTSSGKIRRYACRSMFLDGTLDILESSILEKSPPVETEIGRSESLLPRALLSIEPQKRQELLESHLRDHLAGVLKASPSDLSMDQPISFWGVDSVMAVDLLTELERNMGVTLSIQQVFQDTTISQLAALVLGQLTRTRRDPDGFRIPAEGKKAISEFPLSYGQKALWFVQQMDPSSIAHNVVHAVQIRTDADLSALRKAFERLVARHPALRTSFLSRQGEPFQKVHDRVELCFDVEDATRWGRKKLDQELEEFTFRPFDLTKAPLLRVSVFLRNPLNHILIVSMHHLITDLWSMAIILAELPKLYDHEVTGGSGFPLPPLKTQYSDHVRWEAEMLAGPEGERLWDYWRNRLSGSLPLLDLPVDRPRPPALTDRGAARYFSFDSALTKRLDSLAEDNRTSLFTLLLAAFQTLLHRYTGQDDILVGSPRAGRRHKLARVIGYFINSVVLRGDFSGDPTFLEFLRQMHETVEAAFQHGAFPFPLLVQRLTPEREQGASPIFQVMFAWQKTTSMVAKDAMAAFTLGEEQLKAELGGLIKGPVFLERRATPFDLALWVAEGDIEGENRLRCTIEYKSALFDPETIDRMLGHFNTLLLGIAADPNLPISRLPLLTEREKRRFLKKQEDLPAAFVPVELVHHSLAAQAGRTPDAVALACLDKNLTYAEVNRRANQLSSCLHRAGIKPEEPVGVFLDRSPEAVISLFAILKSGGVYLPIDPASPPERIAFMIKDSGVRVILTQEKFRIKFSEFAVQCSDLRVQSSDFKEVPNPEPGTVICLDSDWEKIAGESGENLMVDATPLNLAYMIYTSGSTGLPKGVLVSHEAFAKHCQEVQEHYRLTPMDRILQFASLAFDASLEQIVPPLISGATVFLMGRDLWMPGNFHRKALELGLTVINLPPAYWRQVVANWGRDRDGAHSLRLIIIGGDLVHPEMVETWLQTSMRAACLLNAYGPTETTITATTFEIPPDPRTSFSSGRVPIGLPLPRRKGCILDKYGNPVPIRVAGELCLGGIGLARGYLGLPERTAEVFIPDPFIAVHGTSSISDVGARLYRTGDLCRYLPDGSIEFLGRIDDQVKLRGFRIELGEVETVLKRHPGVRDAAVLAKEEFKNEDKLLVAYLVLESQQSPSLEELRCHLQRKLPSHMVPAAFIVLDQFPMTAGGKPDRMGLLKMDGKFLTPQEERIPPRTPVEQDLADIWSELLGVRQLAVNDNFFDLGGHSLIATQIAARIRDLYGVDLSLRKFFEAPTIADLASAIVHVLAEEEPDLERLLSQVEALSQENASTMLDDEVQANFISWTPQHARKNLLTPASPAKPAPTSSRVDGSGTGVASKAPGAG
jgi:amino acid adenylation domain-containing protein